MAVTSCRMAAHRLNTTVSKKADRVVQCTYEYMYKQAASACKKAA